VHCHNNRNYLRPKPYPVLSPHRATAARQGYLSNQTSSMRQPLKMLLAAIRASGKVGLNENDGTRHSRGTDGSNPASSTGESGAIG
jgi:hypothetical protein